MNIWGKNMITKETIIAEVLKKHPDVAMIMLERGLHCVGCHANQFESIEAGCKVHSMSDEDIKKLVDEINKFLSSDGDIDVTESAAKKIKELISEEGQGLRISIQKGGCSGNKYQMSLEEKPTDDDIMIEKKDVKVFIDKESFEMIKGSKVDYVDDLNDSGFKITNPNARNSCGGKSFS